MPPDRNNPWAAGGAQNPNSTSSMNTSVVELATRLTALMTSRVRGSIKRSIKQMTAGRRMTRQDEGLTVMTHTRQGRWLPSVLPWRMPGVPTLTLCAFILERVTPDEYDAVAVTVL